jgi:hypothetical protein
VLSEVSLRGRWGVFCKGILGAFGMVIDIGGIGLTMNRSHIYLSPY